MPMFDPYRIADQRVEDRLSSLQLRKNKDDQPPVQYQEFDHEEEVMTMEEDPSQHREAEEFHRGATIRHRRVNQASTGDDQREVPRSSLLDPSIRELAGFPKGSLPSAGVQELAEHHQLYPLEYQHLGASKDLRRLAAETNHRLEQQERRSTVRRSDPTSRFDPVRYFERGEP